VDDYLINDETAQGIFSRLTNLLAKKSFQEKKNWSDDEIKLLKWAIKKYCNGKKITTLFTEHMLDSLKESGRGCIIGSKKLVSEFKEILGDKIEFISDWGRINNFEYVAIYFRKNKRFEIEI
jgi:hypothetical protein